MASASRPEAGIPPMSAHDDEAVARGRSLAAAMEAMRAGRAHDAERICTDYLLLHPGCTYHLRQLAHALEVQGRAGDAEQRLRLAVDLEPGSAQLCEDLGALLAR